MKFSGTALAENFEICTDCEARLYDAVKYCPFCGANQSGTKSIGVAAVAATAVSSASPPNEVPVAPMTATPPSASAVVKPKEPVVQASPAKTATAQASAQSAGSPAVTQNTGEQSLQKPQRARFGIVMGVVLAVFIGAYLSNRPSKKEDACEQSLNEAAVMLAGGDAAGARAQTVLAMASCSGEARVKVSELQTAANKLADAQANCERSFRRISSHISEHRLQSARGTLDQLDTVCVDSPQGKELLTQIETDQAAATAAEAEMRKLLAEGELFAARSAFDQVIARNREHPDLAALRHELAEGANALERTLPTNVPAEIQRERQGEQPLQAAHQQQKQPTIVATPQPNTQIEMAQAFLRDAETAMNMLKFDAAKTYVESASRIDPDNPQAAALWRKIKERELRYLKDETSIK